jgi:hypothetical protein
MKAVEPIFSEVGNQRKWILRFLKLTRNWLFLFCWRTPIYLTISTAIYSL